MNPAAAKNAVGAAFLGATKMDILRDTDMEDTANDAAIAAALGEHAVHPAAIVGLWADEDDEATWATRTAFGQGHPFSRPSIQRSSAAAVEAVR